MTASEPILVPSAAGRGGGPTWRWLYTEAILPGKSVRPYAFALAASTPLLSTPLISQWSIEARAKLAEVTSLMPVGTDVIELRSTQSSGR